MPRSAAAGWRTIRYTGSSPPIACNTSRCCGRRSPPRRRSRSLVVIDVAHALALIAERNAVFVHVGCIAAVLALVLVGRVTVVCRGPLAQPAESGRKEVRHELGAGRRDDDVLGLQENRIVSPLPVKHAAGIENLDPV